MAAQGQNFFVASGDDSTWSQSNPAWPADDAHVVSVGGTDLTTASAGGAWESEIAWAASGGGISPDNFLIPSWQKLPGVINSSNQGSTTYRNGPDVSANANFSFYVCANQTACTANEYGGTSFAAAMWAGYIALTNQELAANGYSTLGFINHYLYSIGVSSSYDTAFHDITSGGSGNYSAVPGYDLVTGWGSPNGEGLIKALVAEDTEVVISGSTQQPLTQDANGNYVVNVTITNRGNVPIATAQVTAATLGSASALSLPGPITNLGLGASAVVTLTFPASSVSHEAATAPLRVSGTYSVTMPSLTGNWGLSFRSVNL